MSHFKKNPSPPSRFIALLQRFGLGAGPSRRIFQQASRLQLPFEALPPPSSSIWWHAGPPLHRLHELPRSALSGPVQEDKADAYATLVRVIEMRPKARIPLDLRSINGLSGELGLQAFPTLEDFAASSVCRHIRIISYRDFLRTLDLALPGLVSGSAVTLRQAAWRGERLFCSGEQDFKALACAIVYARLRGLEMLIQADVLSYHVSKPGLDALDQRYHMLAMPPQAWNDPDFMSLLLDNHLPYSRLSLIGSRGTAECLLLPKQNALANAFGDGLRRAGAPNVVSYLRNLL